MMRQKEKEEQCASPAISLSPFPFSLLFLFLPSLPLSLPLSYFTALVINAKFEPFFNPLFTNLENNDPFETGSLLLYV